MTVKLCLIDNNFYRLESARNALKELGVTADYYPDVHPEREGAADRTRNTKECPIQKGECLCRQSFVIKSSNEPLLVILHSSNPCGATLTKKFRNVPFLLVSGDVATGAGPKINIQATYGINCTSYQRAWKPDRPYSKESWRLFVKKIQKLSDANEMDANLSIIEDACRYFGVDEVLSAALQEVYWRSLPLRIVSSLGIKDQAYWDKQVSSAINPEGKTLIEAMKALLNDRIWLKDLSMSIGEIEDVINPKSKESRVLSDKLEKLQAGQDFSDWLECVARYLKSLRDMFISNEVLAKNGNLNSAE